MRKHDVAVEFTTLFPQVPGGKVRAAVWKVHCKKWTCRYKATSSTMHVAFQRGSDHVQRFRRRPKQA